MRGLRSTFGEEFRRRRIPLEDVTYDRATHEGKGYLHPKKGTRGMDYKQKGRYGGDYIEGTKYEKDTSEKNRFDYR